MSYDLVYLTSFAQFNVFEVRLLCSMNQCFIHFDGWVIFHYMGGPYFVYSSGMNVGCFYLLVIVNIVVINFVCMNLCEHVFSFFGYIHNSEIAGSRSNSV